MQHNRKVKICCQICC